MKKLLLVIMVFGIASSAFAQNRAQVRKEIRDRAVEGNANIQVQHEFVKTPAIPAYKNTELVEEDVIGGTRYDLQTNTSPQNRVYLYDDGSAAGIWTMGLDDAGYPDRGTGYNYFDGSSWGDEPQLRIESIRTGWPSYAPYGENGEMVVSHDFSAGSLYYLTRSEKGSGEWTENEFEGPGVPISWNRSTSSGVDNSIMQMLYITWPEANGGSIYEGMDGALLYARSSNGGDTWDYEHELLDGMTSSEYLSISADNYEWADSKGDNIAFLVGDFWVDLFVMKSTDGGDTWDKTVIFEHPYPLADFTEITDTPYVSDGAHHLAFDSENKVHVVFGINRTYSDGTTWYWFPGVDGVGYWNEDMPTFSNDLNALNPYGHPDSELVDDESLIGWSQDLNDNGEIDILEDWGDYGVSLSSQAQIVIDDMDYVYVVWSSVTESYDNGLLNFRHLWARGSWAPGVWGEFNHLTDDLVHIFDECVYPSISPNTDDENFYLLYQVDTEPGNSVQGTMHAPTDNDFSFMSVYRGDLIPVGVDEANAPVLAENVSQNFPNPFTGSSYVNVEVSTSCSIKLEVTSITGQLVYAVPERKVNAGMTRFEIKSENLQPGIYFYSVVAGESKITKKMIIE